MKIIDVMQTKLAQHKLGYTSLCAWLAWTLWAMLVKPGVFSFEGERVENVLANGASRIFLGGFGMLAIGLFLIVLGTVASLLILGALVLCPIWPGLLMIWSRYKHRELYRLLDAMVDTAKAKRRHE